MRKHSIKVASVAALFAAGLLLFPANALAYPDPCGYTLNGTMGTCPGGDCSTWLGAGRIFRDGVASTCESGKACPGLYSASTQHNDNHFFTPPTDDPCLCVEVAWNESTCGLYVHPTLYSGLAPNFTLWACSGAGYNYMADSGSSMTVTFSGSFPAGGGDMTLHVGTNYYPTNMGCTYSAAISCRTAASLECSLAMIEAKLDELGQ